jgi:hypothetical protein
MVNVSLSFTSKNGALPTTIMYKITPRLHTSEGKKYNIRKRLEYDYKVQY